MLRLRPVRPCPGPAPDVSGAFLCPEVERRKSAAPHEKKHFSCDKFNDMGNTLAFSLKNKGKYRHENEG